MLTNYVTPKIYESFAECVTYDEAIQTLEALFVKPTNEIFARHLLATRCQHAGETLDEYLSLSLGVVSNSDVGGHGFPLFSVSCSFDDLDFTDFQQLAEAFHEVQPWSSSASLALNFPSDYDVLKSMFSHDMSQETHLPRSDSVHQFPLCSSSPQYLIICDMVLPRYV